MAKMKLKKLTKILCQLKVLWENRCENPKLSPRLEPENPEIQGRDRGLVSLHRPRRDASQKPISLHHGEAHTLSREVEY